MNKIMVVDNDTMMLEFMSDLLKNKGHQVLTAKDGLSAIETLETYIPDIMFVDLVMPNISGEKLCRAIRKNPKFNGIYIIILSAIAAELEIDFTEIGANACIAKGSFNKMSEQVLDVLDRVNKKVPDDTTKKTIGLEDVHERKINKELLSLRRHSEAILNNLSEGILELNLNNKVIYANHFAHLITDIGEEELLGSYFTELFEDPHKVRVKEMIGLIDKGPQKISEDLPVMLKGKMVSLSILPVNDEERKSTIVILHDITDRKLFEHELNKTTEKLRKNLIGTMQTISLIIETRDPYTAGHLKEVSKLARSIAQEIGLSADTVDNIRMAGAIHDIGKMSVPAEILSKPGRLTDIEMSLIKTHAESGYNILKDAELPYPIAEITLQHHERMDGSGYPKGLKGDQILLEARIICVADVVEAISSHRPYRPSLGIDIALEEIERNKGLFYDDKVVNACLRLFREKGYKMGRGS